MPERLKVVCIPCKALYKCSAFTFYSHNTSEVSTAITLTLCTA